MQSGFEWPISMQTRQPDVSIIIELPCEPRNRNALHDHCEKRRKVDQNLDRSSGDCLACELIFELFQTIQIERSMRL